MTIYYLTVSGIRNLGVALLDPLLWGAVQAAIKESARAEVRCEGSTGDCFTCGCGSIQFRDDCWTLVPRWLLPEVALRSLSSKEILPDAPLAHLDTMWLKHPP